MDKQPCRYERFRDDIDVYVSANHCTNIWLGVICCIMFLQAIVVVGAGATTVWLYSSNQAEVKAWINLPWAEMAHSVDTSYRDLKGTPIHKTVDNAVESAAKLRSMLDFHDKHTFHQLNSFTDELVKNKGMLDDISNVAKETLPAMRQVNKALGHGSVQDITGILHKTNGVMNFLTKDEKEAKQNYKRGKTLIDQVNNLLHPDNIQRSINAAEKISQVMDSALTPNNVNRTIHAITDFDNSIHKAEHRMSLIGQILGKN